MWAFSVGALAATAKFLRRTLRAVFSSAHIPAAIALVVVLVAAGYAGYLNRTVYKQAERARVQAKVNVIRAKLEGNLNANIQLVRGLVATISTEPNMKQQRFAALVENLFREETQLRNIAAAPNLVVSMMYPMAGNERAVGLDYRTDMRQRGAALRARDTRRLVLAGPVELRQGGQAFIGRFPVYVWSDGRDEFWGIVSAVIDVERLYRDSGLLDADLGIQVALSGRDATGAKGPTFFGRTDIASHNPVTAEVVLPSGTWQISATPTGGWLRTAPNAPFMLLGIAMAIVLVVVPILMAGRLFNERRRNFSVLARREGEMRKLSQRLEIALDASQIGVWEHDLETGELVWDDRLNELYGKPLDGGPRSYPDWADSIHPDDLDGALKDMELSAERGGIYASEYRLKLPDGSIRHVRSKAAHFMDVTGRWKMIGAEWDVSADVKLRQDLERARFIAELKNAELEAAKSRIEHNSLHDSLTGLPNRRYLDQMLATAAQAADNSAALLHIDLDRFKQINDTLGHAAGDAMLVHAAEVLASSVRAGDFVARIGGDEFVVFCQGDVSEGSLSTLAERIILRMREPVPYKGHMCRFGVSVGIAIEQGQDADPKRLLVNADIALYRAKSRGRSRHEFFTDELQAEIVTTKRVADEILGGLERKEFVAHYQPQFDARTLDIVGVEALVRWNHPVKGLLAPYTFLKIAEELNVVATLDRIVLEQALGEFKRWEADGLPIPRISVNVSSRRLRDGELLSGLRTLDIRPGTVAFELVESIFLDDHDELVEWNVNQIKELGIEVEIDDFGTGYASIVSLQKLKPKRMKIDRQLVAPVVKSKQQRKLVESIIEIGKSLGIEVLAEGVETADHARILKDIGCDLLQGYAFGRPMDPTTLRAFVAARSWRKAS